MFIEAHTIIHNTCVNFEEAILAPWVDKQHSNQNLPAILVTDKSKPIDTGKFTVQ